MASHLSERDLPILHECKELGQWLMKDAKFQDKTGIQQCLSPNLRAKAERLFEKLVNINYAVTIVLFANAMPEGNEKS